MFLNEGAGGARSERTRTAIELARRALDADLHVTATRDAAELTSWLTDRAGDYATAIIAGGDGSLSVAFDVLRGRPDVTIGYIPAGFGNATSHLLRLPREPEALTRVLAAKDARPVDLLEVDGRLALFAGAGWDALVAGRYAAAGAKRLRGWAAAVVRSVPDLWRRTPVEVRADGWVVHRGPMELLVAGTTPFYGRGLRVNPGARPDSGRLALRVYRGPAGRLLLEAGRWALRLQPRARRIDAQTVELTVLSDRGIPLQADGDLVGIRGSWRFQVRPHAVRLIGRWS